MAVKNLILWVYHNLYTIFLSMGYLEFQGFFAITNSDVISIFDYIAL